MSFAVLLVLVFTITCEECLRTLVLQDLQLEDSKFNKFLGKVVLLLGRMQDFKFLVRKADFNLLAMACGENLCFFILFYRIFSISACVDKKPYFFMLF